MRRAIQHSSWQLFVALTVGLLILASGAEGAQDPGFEIPEAEQPVGEILPGQEVVPGHIIVKYRENVGPVEQANIRNEERLEKEDELKLIDAEVVQVEDQLLEETIDDLNGRPDIEYAEPDYIVHSTAYTDEPRFAELWGLHNTGQTVNDGTPGLLDVDVNAPEASTITQGDQNTIVAVIDDGVDFSHPDLVGQAWVNPDEVPGNGQDDDNNGYIDDVNGWDFHHNDASVHDDHDFHGTHVAGTIAASSNGKGVVGVAPKVKIMALKFLGPRGGATSNAIEAIGYAKSKGAKISNNSWGGKALNQSLKDAIDASGSLFIAAAGNDGVDTDTIPHHPSSYDSSNILSVAAIRNSGDLASFSNYGSTSVDISAPGVSILSSLPEGKDLPAITLSSIGTSGKAITTGFGVEEISGEINRASFMSKSFSAVNRGTQQVLLVDDDMSDAIGAVRFPNVRRAVLEAIQSATGSDPKVMNVAPDSDGPSLDQLQGRTVVWATGQAPYSSADNQGQPMKRTLTNIDRQTLTEFLRSGGKLILTGRDALRGNPRINANDSLVTGTLGLTVQTDVGYLKASYGSFGTAFANESYSLNSFDLHDVLTPTISTAATQGVYPAGTLWEFLSGTSMATPHATGAAALAASTYPALLDAPECLKKAVMDGGKPATITAGKTVTGAMVDAKEALSHVDTTPPEVTPGDLLSDGKWYNSPQERSFQASDAGGCGLDYKRSGLDPQGQGDFTLSVSDEPTTRDSSGNFVPVEDSYMVYDKVGNSTKRRFSALIDLTKPVLEHKDDITEEATSTSGAVVNYDMPSANEALSGLTAAGVSCSPVTGSTFALGITQVTCSAEDLAGNKVTGSFNVTVFYDWTGFFSPVDNLEVLNLAKAGSAVPVKFSLGGNMDLEVFYEEDNGSTYPRSGTMACDSTDPVDAIEQTVTANSAGLTYDAASDRYTYVWKTNDGWAGTCRQLMLKLDDGKVYRANFKFK